MSSFADSIRNDGPPYVWNQGDVRLYSRNFTEWHRTYIAFKSAQGHDPATYHLSGQLRQQACDTLDKEWVLIWLSSKFEKYLINMLKEVIHLNCVDDFLAYIVSFNDVYLFSNEHDGLRQSVLLSPHAGDTPFHLLESHICFYARSFDKLFCAMKELDSKLLITKGYHMEDYVHGYSDLVVGVAVLKWVVQSVVGTIDNYLKLMQPPVWACHLADLFAKEADGRLVRLAIEIEKRPQTSTASAKADLDHVIDISFGAMKKALGELRGIIGEICGIGGAIAAGAAKNLLMLGR
jgi:hypothetical protein